MQTLLSETVSSTSVITSTVGASWAGSVSQSVFLFSSATDCTANLEIDLPTLGFRTVVPNIAITAGEVSVQVLDLPGSRIRAVLTPSAATSTQVFVGFSSSGQK